MSLFKKKPAPKAPPPVTAAEKKAAEAAVEVSKQAPKPEAEVEPVRFATGGATAEEIAEWRAKHGR